MSDKEKEWLSNFNEEYISGNFNHKGKKFHRSVQSKRDCYNRNNARNRDIVALFRTSGKIEGESSIPESIIDTGINNHEDTLLDLLDIKHKIEKESEET